MTPAIVPSRADELEALARRFAALPAASAEKQISDHAADAIAGRRIDDAVFWQRVKFRSRLMRAMGGRAPAGSAPVQDCAR